jgi:hypothetical protein
MQRELLAIRRAKLVPSDGKLERMYLQIAPSLNRTPGVTGGLNFFSRPADKGAVNAPAPAPDPSLAKAVPSAGLRFVARQPILTKDEKVFGYELLFRDGIEDYFCPKDPEAASKIMLDSSLIMGLDVLCNGGRAFVNCTRDMLLKDYVTLLPSHCGRDPGECRSR